MSDNLKVFCRPIERTGQFQFRVQDGDKSIFIYGDRFSSVPASRKIHIYLRNEMVGCVPTLNLVMEGANEAINA